MNQVMLEDMSQSIRVVSRPQMGHCLQSASLGQTRLDLP